MKLVSMTMTKYKPQMQAVYHTWPNCCKTYYCAKTQEYTRLGKIVLGSVWQKAIIWLFSLSVLLKDVKISAGPNEILLDIAFGQTHFAMTGTCIQRYIATKFALKVLSIIKS